uniref:Uncharacterized protein n=1 Tax=Rhizophagus irregularis (strain DAOM 181602 / DAOM 197198 / MUCL 43194) TaxID=747089 RepID=U9T6C8_RHIID
MWKFSQLSFPEKITQNKERNISDKAEVPDKSKTSDKSKFDNLETLLSTAAFTETFNFSKYV